jgi:uncharacterized protein with FMN-binding domain
MIVLSSKMNDFCKNLRKRPLPVDPPSMRAPSIYIENDEGDRMRNFLKLLFVFVVFGLLSGCTALNNRSQTHGFFTPVFQDGVRDGTAQGYRGPVRVRVSVTEGLIQSIEIIDHREDVFTGGVAMEDLLELVLEYNSVDLDAVSGATESSAGFLAAVEAALNNE